MTTVADVAAAVERLWPGAGAEDWDAVGLVAGHPDDVVERVLLAVDAVLETAAEALETRAQMLIVHHPLLLRGVTSVAATTPKGAIVTDLVRGGCALLAAHTNADIVERGTSAELARVLGLVDATPIVASEIGGGLGRVGELADPMTLGALATRIARAVPSTASGIRVAGAFDREVRTVAVCGGAGDSMLTDPAVLAADVYVTSDLRHHPASEARDRHALGMGPALIDVSHWASEWLWLAAAAEQLRAALPDLEIAVSELRTDPWDFQVPQ